jgi:oleate hydratase
VSELQSHRQLTRINTFGRTGFTRLFGISALHQSEDKMANDRKAYLVGGGIGSLAAAAFAIRDGGLPGKNITVYEVLPILGGSLDGAGNPEDGYSMRGGRMLTTDNYECTWGLFKTIPSLEHPGQTVFDETVAFNERMRSHSKARLVDRNRAIVDVTSMGFSMTDRIELLRLAEASEDRLGASRITDWLSPEFFETKFWYMWATTFAFQPWHSAPTLSPASRNAEATSKPWRL